MLTGKVNAAGAQQHVFKVHTHMPCGVRNRPIGQCVNNSLLVAVAAAAAAAKADQQHA